MTITSSRKGRRWPHATLPRFVVVVWIAWFAGGGLMWGLSRMEAMHPHFLLLATLLAIEVLGGVAVLSVGLWRAVRGPQRAPALGWLLLGTTPIWLSAGPLTSEIRHIHRHDRHEGRPVVTTTDRAAVGTQAMVNPTMPGKHPLHRVRVAKGLEEDWNAFLTQSAAAWAQTEAAYRQVQLEFEETLTERSAAGPKTIRHQNIAIACDGDRHRMLFETGLGTTAVVASPQQSFHLVRKPGATRWMVAPPQCSDEPKFVYAGNRNWIRNQGRPARPAARLDNWICDPEFTVTALEPFFENGERRVRVRFEYSLVREGKTLQRHGHLVFLPEARWALQSSEAFGTGTDGKPWCEQLEVEYGAQHAGVSVIRSLQWVTNHPKLQTQYASITRIHRCKFGPTPAEKFTLADFGVAPPGWSDRRKQVKMPWHLIVTWSGSAIALALGMSILVAAVCRRKPVWVRETPALEFGRPYSFSNMPGSAGWRRVISRS